MHEKINMYIPLWATKCISLNNKFDRVAKEQVSEDRFHVKYFIQILRAWISNSIIIFYLIFLFKTTGKFRIIRNSKTFRNSRSQMFFKINVLKNFAMFIGKHLCWSLFWTKLQAFEPAALLKADSNTGVFLWIQRNFQEQLFL